MRIADHPYIGNWQNSAILPKCYTTLDRLCAIRDPGGDDEKTIKRFEKVVKKGFVSPTMDEEQIALAIFASKPPSEQNVFVEPEIITQRKWKSAIKAVDKLSSTQIWDLYNELKRRVGEKAA